MAPHPTNITPKQHYYATANPVILTKEHCIRVKKLLNLGSNSSVVYVRGKTEHTRDNTDVDLEFRQESHFYYLTGKY
jgi:Xaa-Pro dipeptidase